MPAKRKLGRRRFLCALSSGILLPSLMSPTQSQTSLRVKVGTLPIDEGAQAFYAQDQGLFAQKGIDAEIRAMPSGPAIVAAAASGEIDVGFGNLFAFAAAFAAGAPLRIIAPGLLFTTEQHSVALIVRADSPIREGKDFNGKRIGIRAAVSLVGIGARAWIDQHGGDSRTIELVPIDGKQREQALDGGQLDAVSASLTEVPVGKDGTRRIVGYPTDVIAPRFLGAGWFARTSWINANREAARRFSQAIVAASHWANAHQDESAQILTKHSRLTADDVQALAGHRALYSETLDPTLIEPLIAVAVRYGAIPKAFAAQEAVELL